MNIVKTTHKMFKVQFDRFQYVKWERHPVAYATRLEKLDHRLLVRYNDFTHTLFLQIDELMYPRYIVPTMLPILDCVQDIVAGSQLVVEDVQGLIISHRKGKDD